MRVIYPLLLALSNGLPSDLALFFKRILNGFRDLKIPSNPNGILDISEVGNHLPETVVFKANFNDFQHFSSFFIEFCFVFPMVLQCFSATSKSVVFLMEYLLFGRSKSPLRNIVNIKHKSVGFSTFQRSSIHFPLF